MRFFRGFLGVSLEVSKKWLEKQWFFAIKRESNVITHPCA
jgi:hypothetical protein